MATQRRVTVFSTALAVFACFATASTASSQDTEVDEDNVQPAVFSDFGWSVNLFGHVRAGFESVQDDPNFTFVGQNDGFVLRDARLGVETVSWETGTRLVLSFEGASDLRDDVNDPRGRLEVALRDAYMRQDFWTYLGIQVGQFKLPFSAEELMGEEELTFISRAVGVEGVTVGRGFETDGIEVNRHLGVMLSNLERAEFGESGAYLNYYLAASNGNGINELLNDNQSLALTGRLELGWANGQVYWGGGRGEDQIEFRVGGATHFNERTGGEIPNLTDETQLGISADLYAKIVGFRLFGQFTTLTTEFVTTGGPDREQLSIHGQLSYEQEISWDVFVEPAVRMAYYHPRSEGGATDDRAVEFDTYQVTEFTIGLNVWRAGIPLVAMFNYTITSEEEPRVLENNRLEILLKGFFDSSWGW